jgi:hypothetical protein
VTLVVLEIHSIRETVAAPLTESLQNSHSRAAGWRPTERLTEARVGFRGSNARRNDKPIVTDAMKYKGTICSDAKPAEIEQSL